MASVNMGSSVNMSLAGVSNSSTSGSCESAAARRKILSIVVGCVLQESGFASVDKAALGTLVELLQSTIVEMGRTAKGYCELAYRTEPVIADIILALADMGINYSKIQVYSRRVGRNTVAPPQVMPEPKQHSILQVGDKNSHPAHIPDHFPPFPDTHSYCFTPTVKQPVTEYEAIREKAASQKRDIERALCKFSTKTNPVESLFVSEDKDFALVCVAPSPTQNIDALMPRDQVFEAELDDEVSKIRKKRQDRLNNFQQQQALLKQEQGGEQQDQPPEPKVPETTTTESQPIDNPYLRPVKMPRKMNFTRRRNSNKLFSNNTWHAPNANKSGSDGLPSQESAEGGPSHMNDVPGLSMVSQEGMTFNSSNASGIISPRRDNSYMGMDVASFGHREQSMNVQNYEQNDRGREDNYMNGGSANLDDYGISENLGQDNSMMRQLGNNNDYNSGGDENLLYNSSSRNNAELSSYMENEDDVISPEARDRTGAFSNPLRQFPPS